MRDPLLFVTTTRYLLKRNNMNNMINNFLLADIYAVSIAARSFYVFC